VWKLISSQKKETTPKKKHTVCATVYLLELSVKQQLYIRIRVEADFIAKEGNDTKEETYSMCNSLIVGNFQ